MKAFITLFFMLFANLTMAQGLIFSTLSEKPKVLDIEIVRPQNGEPYFVHVKRDPLTKVRIEFKGEKLGKLKEHLLKKNYPRLFATAKFVFAYDEHGSQYIDLKSVTIMTEEDGWIVAHSIGGNVRLTPSEVQEKDYELQRNIQREGLKRRVAEPTFEPGAGSNRQ